MHHHWPTRLCRGSGLLFAIAAVIFLAGLVGYQQIFSTFAMYDDEGYVMMSLCRYMQGRPLYDDVFTQYGPAYYVLQSNLNDGLNLPVTHDVTRLKSLVLWLGVSCCAAGCVRRMTLSWLAAFIAFCLVFCHLDKLCLEPGHPQELVALCVIGAIMAGSCLDSSGSVWRRIGLVGLGALLGVALLTKLNAGVFLALSISMVLFGRLPSGKIRSFVLTLFLGLVVLLPFALFRRELTDMTVLTLPVVAACAAVALYRRTVFCEPTSTASVEPRTESEHRVDTANGRETGQRSYVMWVSVSLTLVVAMMLTRMHWQGTSWAGLWRGIVSQHWSFGQRFFHTPDLLPWAMFWSVAILCLQPRWTTLLRWTAVVLVFGTITAQFLQTSVPLVHGLQPRGFVRVLMSLVPSLLVLLVMPRPVSMPSSQSARGMLAWVGLLQPLAVFPTPGTQSAVGSICLLMACIVIAHDLLVQVHGVERTSGSNELLPMQEMSTTHLQCPRFVWRMLLAGSLAVLLWRGVWLTKYRQGLVALDLPGCRLLALEPELVERYRWLVGILRENSDTFVFAEHGHNSVYFWTQMEPPTSLNVTFWPYLLRPEEQSRIVSALKEKQRVCVVHEKFGADLPNGALRSYLQGGEFHSEWSNGTYQIAVRRSGATHDSATRKQGD